MASILQENSHPKKELNIHLNSFIDKYNINCLDITTRKHIKIYKNNQCVNTICFITEIFINWGHKRQSVSHHGKLQIVLHKF